MCSLRRKFGNGCNQISILRYPVTLYVLTWCQSEGSELLFHGDLELSSVKPWKRRVTGGLDRSGGTRTTSDTTLLLSGLWIEDQVKLGGSSPALSNFCVRHFFLEIWSVFWENCGRDVVFCFVLFWEGLWFRSRLVRELLRLARGHL